MEFRDTTFNKLLQNQITPDRMAPCVSGCVRWVEVYFKDCVCDLSSGISFGLGLLSLACWAIAEIPQIITNFQTKSGHGVSLCFLLTWVTGDVFNLVGCVLEPATLPTQFYSAVLYAVTTLVLVVQTIYYDDCFTRWWKHRGYGPTSQVDEERKPLNPDKYGPTMPIFATVSTATSTQMDVHYTSATSHANSGSSPYGGASYLRVARSGPSDFCAALHDSSEEDEEEEEEDEDEDEHEHRLNITRPKRIASHSVRYGTFVLGSACLPFQAKALIQMDLYGKDIIQETIMNGLEANTYGMILGWIMASIYMGGRLPQIYLNIKRGNVEGLNPLMFIFALIANATYVGSILVRSVQWDRLKANAPWLLDAIVCVLLDLLIIVQFAYYKLRQRRIDNNVNDYENLNEKKLLV